MNNACLVISNREYFEKEISERDSWQRESLSDFELEALGFAYDWLTGVDIFKIRTSGSTGIPKVITVNRIQMLASAEGTIHALGLRDGDKALLCLNPAFIAGKMMIVRALVGGLFLYVRDPSSSPLEGFFNTVEFAAMVPMQLQQTLNDKLPFTSLKNAKALILGGAPVGIGLEKMIQDLSFPVYATYGMTETVSHIALRRINGTERQSEFQLLDNIEIDLDNRGCLRVKGAVTNHQWEQTNDLVEILNSKEFVWKGRYDRVVNSGGVKLHLDQIEDDLQREFIHHDWKINFFLHSVQDELLGSKLIMLIENFEGIDLDEIEKAFSVLNKYQRPKRIFIVDEFIKTTTDKLDRNKSFQRLTKQNTI